MTEARTQIRTVAVFVVVTINNNKLKKKNLTTYHLHPYQENKN